MKKRLLFWSALAIVVVIGVIATEVAKRANVHVYSSNRGTVEWPESLRLDRSDLKSYLRYQFNVELDVDSAEEEKLVIRAGLCQVAGRDAIEAMDILAAEATIQIARQPWFGEFTATEIEKMDKLRGERSLDELRTQFIDDLAALDLFQVDFSRFLALAARSHGIEIEEGAEP